MRDYGKVAPAFWTGKVGRALRGDAPAQIVAMYLLTSPHANMIGVSMCPALYIAHDTGLPLDEVQPALERLEKLGFCIVDRERDLVWVCEMSRFENGEQLKPGDKRRPGIASLAVKLPTGPVKDGFFARYGSGYGLPDYAPSKPLPRPIGDPSKGSPPEQKPHGSQEQKQEQDSSVLKDGRPEAPPDLSGNSEPIVVPDHILGSALIDAPRSPPLRVVAGSEAAEEDAPDPTEPERELFRRGREVLGRSAGGQITKLLKAKDRSVPLARAAIETAATKQDPGEYIGAIIRGNARGLAPGQLYDRGL